MHGGIAVGQRVESGVIPKRSLHNQWLSGVDVPLDDQFRLGRHHEITGHRFGEQYRLATQETGEDVFVYVRRKRR